MANLTITIDDEVLRRARLRALQQDTSVNALLRDYLTAFASADSTWQQATDELLRLSTRAKSGRGGRRWTRDELHERR
jgi:plasmid stability protein